MIRSCPTPPTGRKPPSIPALPKNDRSWRGRRPLFPEQLLLGEDPVELIGNLQVQGGQSLPQFLAVVEVELLGSPERARGCNVPCTGSRGGRPPCSRPDRSRWRSPSARRRALARAEGVKISICFPCGIPCNTARTEEAERLRPVGMTASSYCPTGMRGGARALRAELSRASIAPSHRLRRLFWVNRNGSGGARRHLHFEARVVVVDRARRGESCLRRKSGCGLSVAGLSEGLASVLVDLGGRPRTRRGLRRTARRPPAGWRRPSSGRAGRPAREHGAACRRRSPRALHAGVATCAANGHARSRDKRLPARGRHSPRRGGRIAWRSGGRPGGNHVLSPDFRDAIPEGNAVGVERFAGGAIFARSSRVRGIKPGLS